MTSDVCDFVGRTRYVSGRGEIQSVPFCRLTNIEDKSLPLFSREQESVSHDVRTMASGRPHQPTGTNVVAWS